MAAASSPITAKPSPSRLAQARAEAGLTQEELAQKAKVSVFSIGKYERGERSPRGPRLRRIAQATKKPIEWFFDAQEQAA